MYKVEIKKKNKNWILSYTEGEFFVAKQLKLPN